MKSFLTRAALGALLLTLFSGCSLIVDTDSLQGGSGQFTVGLSTYWPVVGENVRAIPAGPGSGGSVNYQWFRNGTPIEGANSAAIATNTMAGGDELSLEASASSSDIVLVGPVTILSNEIRWRPIRPNGFAGGPPTFVYEPTHRRWLNVLQEGLSWEYTVEDDELVPRPLRPYGAAPPSDFFAVPIMDDVNHRVLVMLPQPGSALTEMSVLDTSHRGAENWSTLVLPTPIDVGFIPAVAMDPSGVAAWIFGVDLVALQPVLTRFEFGTPGSETVTVYPVVDVPASNPLPVFPSMAIDPTNADRVLLFGGIDEQDDQAFMEVGIITVDRALETASMTLGASLPAARFYTQAIPDPERGEVLLAFGIEGDLDSGSAPPPTTLRYEVAADSFRVVGPAPAHGVLGHAASDPERGSQAFQILPGVDISEGLETSDTAIYHGSLDSDEMTRAAGYTSVTGRSGMAVSGRSGRLRIAGGQLSDYDRASPAVYDLDLGTMEWTEMVPAEDPVAMESPGPWADTVSASATSGGSVDIWYVGGTRGGGDFADTRVWELHRDGYWLYRTLTPPADPMDPYYVADIPQLRGATQYEPRCGAQYRGIFGGILTDGQTSSRAFRLECDHSNPRDCQWYSVSDGMLPPARSYATGGTTDGSHLWFWGGFDSMGDGAQSAHGHDGCSGAPAWFFINIDSAMMPMGMAPVGRGGHSMTYVPSVIGSLESWIVFGGSEIRDPGDSHYRDDAFRLVWTDEFNRRAEPIEPVDSYRPPARRGHATYWDESRSRLVVFGGERGSDVRSDIWELLIP